VKLRAAGVFDRVDAAMMFHPADADVLDPLMVALRVLDVEFRGKAAHAAAAPYAGVNALDALLLGWSAMSALRQLVRSDSRIHGIITDGGQATNVIPERAAARIVVRAADPSYLGDLRRRVLACFEGAATATGCELHHTWGESMDMVTTNQPMASAFAANARILGRELGPRRRGETSGSTDMGTISSVIPSIHPFLSVSAERVPWHSREFAAAARTPRALETMRVAAKALAFTAIDLLARPELLKQAKAAFTPPRSK
jgi:metal-dependent amidase/aminoacylase/carboxypeptidase family protein